MHEIHQRPLKMPFAVPFTSRTVYIGTYNLYGNALFHGIDLGLYGNIEQPEGKSHMVLH